jgi:hypothetical protein
MRSAHRIIALALLLALATLAPILRPTVAAQDAAAKVVVSSPVL